MNSMKAIVALLSFLMANASDVQDNINLHGEMTDFRSEMIMEWLKTRPLHHGQYSIRTPRASPSNVVPTPPNTPANSDDGSAANNQQMSHSQLSANAAPNSPPPAASAYRILTPNLIDPSDEPPKLPRASPSIPDGRSSSEVIAQPISLGPPLGQSLGQASCNDSA